MESSSRDTPSFDDLIGPAQQRFRNGEADRESGPAHA
jgi:hypothetical protein